MTTMNIDGMELKQLIIPKDQTVTFRIGMEPVKKYFHFIGDKKIECNKTNGKSCDLCKSAALLYKAGDSESIDAARRMFSKERYYYHIEVEKSRKDIKAGHYYLECGKIVNSALFYMIVNYEKYKFVDKDGCYKPVRLTYKRTKIKDTVFYTYENSVFTIGKNKYSINRIQEDERKEDMRLSACCSHCGR